MPRVVAGKVGGIPLKAPKGDRVRPTADKTKEAIFSSIAEWLDDAEFLDLFAGSGQMGIEALSRGAKQACFVDKSRTSIDYIKENLAKTRFEEEAEVLSMDAKRACDKFLAQNRKFDVIYFDPPYAEFEKLFEKLADEYLAELLREDGILITEADSHDQEIDSNTADTEKLTMLKRCQYGQAMVSFYQIKSN